MSKELEALEKIKDIIREDAEDIDNPTLLVNELSIIETALKEYEELLKIEYKQNTINDFYPNTRKMINDLLDLLTTKMCDFLKDGETYTKTNLLETMGFAIRYVKTFAYGQEFNETEKVGVNAKKLKVLEIIKDKRVELGAFIRDFVEGTDTYNEYYEDIDEYHYYRKGDHETPILTQKEFDLLKEMLL